MKALFAFLVLVGIFLYAQSLTGSEKVIPTPSPFATATPTVKKPQEINIFDLFYPGAKQISFDDNTLILESLDDPDKITEWYEEKIKQLAMNAKSFSKTTANGNVLNTLVASDGKTEIRVEITKQKKQKSTKIVVTVKRA